MLRRSSFIALGLAIVSEIFAETLQEQRERLLTTLQKEYQLSGEKTDQLRRSLSQPKFMGQGNPSLTK